MNKAREHVKYIYGTGGMKPGSFTQALIEAIIRADKANLAKLRGVYPEYVESVELERGY